MATRSHRRGFNAAEALTRDFLTWLSDAPRTYTEAMEVWRTSCPRFPVWEDALADELIQVVSEPGQPFSRANV